MENYSPQLLMEAYHSVYVEPQQEVEAYEAIVDYLASEGLVESYEEADELIEGMSDEEIDGILDEVTGRGYIEPVTGRHTRSHEANRQQKPGSPAMGLMGRNPYEKNRTKAQRVQSLPPTPENQRRLRKLNTGEKVMMARYNASQQAAHAARSDEYKRLMNPSNESYDNYDLILSHLLDEGYADSEDAALQIMSNMSEDWLEGILEGFKPTNYLRGSGKTSTRIRNQIKRLKKSKPENAYVVDFINRMMDTPEGRQDAMETSRRNRQKLDSRARRAAQRDYKKYGL